MLHALLCLLPAIVLALPLLARRYPGERALLALRGGEPRRWPHPRSCASTARRALSSGVRGTLLLGRALAVRPPPALSATS